MARVIVCVDRDGTLLYEDKYNLGKQRNWKTLIKILPGVLTGLRKLRKLPNVSIYMITNQAGVAVQNFPLLTVKKAHEVCEYVMKLFKEKGVPLDGYFMCPYASPAYVKKRGDIYTFDPKMVKNARCRKPNPGMIYDALRDAGIKRRDASIYVIGDRASDVKTALNVRGTAIFVPFKNEMGEVEKVQKIKGKVYNAKNFTDAVDYIIRREG